MKRIREKHSLLARWAHWVNFPILLVMTWSGLLIYWANDEYQFRLFGHTFFPFFPEWVYKALNIPYRLAEGMAFHFLFMWFFAVNGIVYVICTIISGEWKELLPNRHSFKEAWLVLLHDLHIRKVLPPQDKYNAAQRIAYTSIIIMGFGSLVTGLAIYKPVQFYWLTALCGGYRAARIEHFVLTIGYVLFFLIHIVQVLLAGWNNFRSMVSGFEVVKEGNKSLKTKVMRNLFRREKNVKLLSAKHLHRRNFISFAGFIGLNAVAYSTWRWLYKAPFEERSVTAGARKPLRRALNQTELAARKTFSHTHLVKTYPKSMAAKKIRVNSLLGMSNKEVDMGLWRLDVKRQNGALLHVTMEEISALPKTEIVFDFKCVEGWDQISYWGGVRFSDFVSHFGLQAESKLDYVGLATPDSKYYVGIDMQSAMHPQTLLAYEVNGQPLPAVHGHPLRLIIPVKYGIKNLKRIGTMSFSAERPPDYWAERGYDYYSGL